MKQTQMYICTLEEFILDDLHYLEYKLGLRYCMENTLVFIQSQKKEEKCENCSWMTIDRVVLTELQ